MPIWLRQYYLKRIIEFNEDQGAKMAEQQARNAQQSQNSNSILRPAIKPPQN